MATITIRVRQVREGDLAHNLPGVPEHFNHVAWIEGEYYGDYEKNTGRTDAEAIGSLLIELTCRLSQPFTVAGIVLEDIEGTITAEGREISDEELAGHPLVKIGGGRE